MGPQSLSAGTTIFLSESLDWHDENSLVGGGARNPDARRDGISTEADG